MVQSNHIQEQIAQAAEAEKALFNSGEQVLVGATKYQDSSTFNAVAKATVAKQKFSDFTSLTIQYIQE